MTPTAADKKSNPLANLAQQIRQFSEEREWQDFHSPKNLSTALAVEAAEVMEIFQWMTESESKNLTQSKRSALQKELADVFIYLIQLGDKTGIDLIEAANQKLKVNAEKYPTELVKGSAKKYTEY